jgi:hypothetical protein
MPTSAISWTAVGVISAIIIAMIAFAFVVARSFSDKASQQLEELDIVDEGFDADPLSPRHFATSDTVDAQATASLSPDAELEHCPHCGAPIASLTAMECWLCFASLDDDGHGPPKAA